jgi:hypothetical protein
VITQAEIKQKLIAERNAAIEAKKNAGNSSDWQIDKAVESITNMVNEKIDSEIKLQVAKHLESKITPIQESGYDYNGVDLKDNRYGLMVKRIAQDGYFQVRGKKITPADLVLAKEVLDKMSGSRGKRSSKDLNYAIHALKPHISIAKHVSKSLRTDTAGQGLELTPDETSNILWTDYYLQDNLMSRLPVSNFEQNMADRKRHPFIDTDVKWTTTGQGAAINIQTPDTDRAVINYTKKSAAFQWSGEFEEDAIIEAAPTMRAAFIESGQRLISDFFINADGTTPSGNINLHDATPPANAYYMPGSGDDGLIKQWLDNVAGGAQAVDGGGNALDYDEIVAAAKLVHKYFTSPWFSWLTDVVGWISIGALDEVKTVDKYGSGASVISGPVDIIMGKPVIVSTSHRLADTNGKISATATNNIFGRLSAFDGSRWKAGITDMVLKQFDKELEDLTGIVAHFRIGVTTIGDRATNEHTSGIYHFS